METYPASVPSTSQETVKERQVEPLVVKPFKISLKTVTGSGGDKGKEEKLKKKKEKEKEKDKITKPLTMKVKKEKKLGMLENVIQKLHDSSLSQIGSSQSSSLEINTVKQAVKIVEEVVISAAPVQPPLKMTFSKTPGPDELAIKKKKKKKKHLDEQRDDHQHRRPESTETQEVAVVPSAVAPAAIPKLKIIMKKVKKK